MGTRYSKGDFVTVKADTEGNVYEINRIESKDSDSPDYFIENIETLEEHPEAMRASYLQKATIEEMPDEALEVRWEESVRNQRASANAQIPVDDVFLGRVDTEEGYYMLQANMKTGDGRTPYTQEKEAFERDLKSIENAGYEVSYEDGKVEFDDGTTMSKAYYLQKRVEIPSSVETVQELYDHIEENLD